MSHNFNVKQSVAKKVSLSSAERPVVQSSSHIGDMKKLFGATILLAVSGCGASTGLLINDESPTELQSVPECPANLLEGIQPRYGQATDLLPAMPSTTSCQNLGLDLQPNQDTFIEHQETPLKVKIKGLTPECKPYVYYRVSKSSPVKQLPDNNYYFSLDSKIVNLQAGITGESFAEKNKFMTYSGENDLEIRPDQPTAVRSIKCSDKRAYEYFDAGNLIYGESTNPNFMELAAYVGDKKVAKTIFIIKSLLKKIEIIDANQNQAILPNGSGIGTVKAGTPLKISYLSTQADCIDCNSLGFQMFSARPVNSASSPLGDWKNLNTDNSFITPSEYERICLKLTLADRINELSLTHSRREWIGGCLDITK